MQGRARVPAGPSVSVAAVRAILTIPAVLGVAVVAGCGGGAAPEPDAPAAVAEAAEATRLARTARVGWKVTTEGFGLPREMTLKGRGTTSLTTPLMSLRLDLGPALRRGGSADLVVRGEDLFVRPRVRGFELPRGADWVALDVRRALRRTSGGDADAIGDALALDPSTRIDALGRAGAVREVGPARVGGKTTTHYRARDRATGGYEVWIDERDRVRRLRQTAAVPSHGDVPEGEVGVTMELSDFGAKLAAPAPSAAATYDATQAVAGVLAASQ